MKLQKKISKAFRKQRFDPTLPLGLVLNDSYLPKRCIRNFVKKGASYFTGKVLDVGCGGKPYQAFFKCESYIGIDLETGDLERNEYNAADFYYDGLTIPFGNDSFDQVVSTEVIEHVADPILFMQEINRVLKPGGIVMLTTPFVWHEHGVPFDYQRLTYYGMDNLMKKTGFREVESKKILNGPELFPVLVAVYVNDLKTRLLKKMGNKRLLSILLYLFFRPFILLNNIFTLFLSIFPRDKNLYFNNGVIYRKV